MKTKFEIDVRKSYATSVFVLMKKAEIKEGTWQWSEDIEYEEWVQKAIGYRAALLIPKMIPETLPDDCKVTVESIVLTDPTKDRKEKTNV